MLWIRSSPKIWHLVEITLSQTTNFRLFQTERVCRRRKWKKVLPMGRKHWKSEKFPFTSNFSYSHSVFKSFVLQTHKTQGLYGKGLNTSSHHKNIVTRGETTSNFSFWNRILFPQRYLYISSMWTDRRTLTFCKSSCHSCTLMPRFSNWAQ